MTKATECALLDEMITKFGPHSYLGPWLKDNRISILADISSDICVSAPMPSEAMKQGLAIIADAKAQAAEIIKQATKQAEAGLQKAYDDAASVRRHAKWLLEEAAKKL